MLRRLTSLLLAVLAVTGCGSAGASAPPIGTTRLVATGAPAVPTLPPTPMSQAPSPEPSPTGRPTASVAPEVTEPVPGISLPPLALLSVDGGEPMTGELGTYVYEGSGSDAPWLPAASLESVQVPSGATLELTLEDASAFVSWSAQVAAAEDVRGESKTGLGQSEGSTRMESAAFASPETGQWVLAARVFYPDDRGDAVFFWLLDVS